MMAEHAKQTKAIRKRLVEAANDVPDGLALALGALELEAALQPANHLLPPAAAREALGLLVRLEASCGELRLRALAADPLRVRAEGEGLAGLLVGEVVRLWLDAGRGGSLGPLEGRVEARLGRSVELGLAALSASDARAVLRLAAAGDALRASAMPEAVEVIDDPARVRALLTGLASTEARATVWAGGAAHEARLESVGARVQLFALDLDAHRAGRVEVEGYNSVFRFAMATLEPEGPHRASGALPAQLVRVRRRRVRRVHAEAGWRVELAHPLWSARPLIARPVVDLALGGLSFITAPEEDLLFPGLRLPALEVVEPSGERLRLAGEVRTLRARPDGLLPVCGLSVRAHDVGGSARWQRAVQRQGVPAIEPASGRTQAMWELFESSGYFHLGGHEGARYAAQRGAFEAASAKAARAPHLFDQILWKSSRGVEATASLFKPYRGTWCGHQLARRADGSPAGAEARQVLRDIYTAILERPWAFPGFSWFMAYVEPTVPFMARVHVEFAARHAPSGRALALPFAFMEADCAEAAECMPRTFAVGEATPEELDALAVTIARSRPRAYVEALDLSREHLDLAQARHAWAMAGMERERCVLVARDPIGAPCAAAVLEVGEPGTNLFRLLDAARLFSLAEGGEAAFSELLDRARAWFRAHGRERYLYFREHPSEAHALRAGLRPVSAPTLCILAAELVPDFIEHVYERTGPRPASASLNPLEAT